MSADPMGLAIVGGIVALSAPAIPAEWLERREPLGISHLPS
jgi:hypothetical protein